MKIQLIKDSVDEIISPEEKERFRLKDQLLRACNFEASTDVGDLMRMYLVAALVKDKIRDDLFDAHLSYQLGKQSDFPKVKKDILHSLARVETYLCELQPCVQREIDKTGHNFNMQEKTTDLIKAMRTERKDYTHKGKRLREAIALRESIINEIEEISGGKEPQE